MRIDADHDAGRCPRCGALVRAGAAWCSLCYADLRPALAASREASLDSTSREASLDSARAESIDPLAASLALLERRVEPPSAAPRGRHAAPEPTQRAEPTGRPTTGWPCARCGALVPIDDQTCGQCGAGFLEGLPDDGSKLDALVSKAISTQTKVLIMVGGSVGLLLLIFGLMYLFGAVF